MNFREYHRTFDEYMGVKKSPDSHEEYLFTRAKHHIARLRWIPGIRMVAVVNSLSQFATHKDSDIDLFIVTRVGYLWLVRVLVTLVFSLSGVWRKGEDVSGNFCLSFFVDEKAMDLERVAIEEDIYLYVWIYSLKPLLASPGAYEEFLESNRWVVVSPSEKKKNQRFLIPFSPRTYPFWLHPVFILLNALFRSIGERKSLTTFREKRKPEGVIITEHMLKFHDQDRRKEIRDEIRKIVGQK